MQIDLKSLLLNTEFTRKDKILVILYASSSELPVKEIRELAVKNGLREIIKWNISQVLKDLKSNVINLPNGWLITDKGKNHLSDIGVISESPIAKVKPTLHKYSEKVTDSYVKEFVNEAIRALETGLLRSSIVLSWVGAISVLYKEVENNYLDEFNVEAKRRNSKWKDANNVDGLCNMKEYDFLQIIAGISIIGKNVKSELENCLKLRNSCGHPSTLKVGENKVASHLEILILNVFSKF